MSDNKMIAMDLLDEMKDLFGRRGFSEHEIDNTKDKLRHTAADAAMALTADDPDIKRGVKELGAQYEKYLKAVKELEAQYEKYLHA